MPPVEDAVGACPGESLADRHDLDGRASYHCHLNSFFLLLPVGARKERPCGGDHTVRSSAALLGGQPGARAAPVGRTLPTVWWAIRAIWASTLACLLNAGRGALARRGRNRKSGA